MKNDILESDDSLHVFVLTDKNIKRIYNISPLALGYIESASDNNKKYGYKKEIEINEKQ